MTTPADQPDLIAWLRAQLDDDERVATEAESDEAARHWSRTSGDPDWNARIEDGNGDVVVYDEGAPSPAEAEHIARHDPARVLAEVDAKRRILDLFEQTEFGDFTRRTALEEALSLLALPYAGREGFRDEWRPA